MSGTQNFRENPLSGEPGGSTIVIKYSSTRIDSIQDNVKNVMGYLHTTFTSTPDAVKAFIRNHENNLVLIYDRNNILIP